MNFGALRDPPGTVHGEPLERLVGVRNLAPFALPFDMRPFAKTFKSQRKQECVGQAIGQCSRVGAELVGVTLDPSVMAPYSMALVREHGPRATYLPDRGCFPAFAFEELREYGLVASARWPDDIDPTLPPPEDIYEAGFIAIVTGEYEIPTGPDCQGEIEKALAAKHPVFWTRDVDASYSSLGGELYQGLAGEVLGGHAGCLLFSDAQGAYDAGSYGLSHGVRGVTHQSWAFLKSKAVHMFKAFTSVILVVQ